MFPMSISWRCPNPDLRSSLDVFSSSSKHRKRTGSSFVVIVSHPAHSSEPSCVCDEVSGLQQS